MQCKLDRNKSGYYEGRHWLTTQLHKSAGKGLTGIGVESDVMQQHKQLLRAWELLLEQFLPGRHSEQCSSLGHKANLASGSSSSSTKATDSQGDSTAATAAGDGTATATPVRAVAPGFDATQLHASTQQAQDF